MASASAAAHRELAGRRAACQWPPRPHYPPPRATTWMHLNELPSSKGPDLGFTQ
ncbi:MAG: hypothetical protein ACREOZ_00935 [Gloeomargaritales cyanobacterium]